MESIAFEMLLLYDACKQRTYICTYSLYAPAHNSAWRTGPLAAGRWSPASARSGTTSPQCQQTQAVPSGARLKCGWTPGRWDLQRASGQRLGVGCCWDMVLLQFNTLK